MRKISLKEEQNIQLEMLEYVDNICKCENIQYFLGFGSLLGAIREKKFIKWDDDIDIFMKRQDFIKFSKVVKKYRDERFFFQSVETDKNFIVPEMQRICKNDTFKWGKKYIYAKFHTGIYLDFFALDYANKENKVNKKKFELSKKLHLIIMKKAESFSDSSTLKGKLAYIVSKFLTIQTWYRVYLWNIKRQKNKDKTRLICYSSPYQFENSIFQSSDFDYPIYVLFNGKLYPCPKGYDNILKIIYGEYMTPINTRSRRTTAYMQERVKGKLNETTKS